MAEIGTTVLRSDTDTLATLCSHLPAWNVLPPVALQLRCVSSRGDLVVLGTHLDVALVFYRDNGELQKVSLEAGGFKLFGSRRREGVSVTRFSPVTPSGLSRVAIGRNCGLVHVIQFSDKESERKSTVFSSLHTDEVTSLDWDTRGMMLFSADASGRVFASHLDMKTGKHNSWLVHDARERVLQISYFSMMLLVATADSCTLCHIHQNVFQKKPAKINQNKPQPLKYHGGILLKEEVDAQCFMACQTLNFLQASSVGQVLRVSALLHQVEYGTFDTVLLPCDQTHSSPSATRALAAESLEFGRVLAIGPHLITWCDSHVWLIQPTPAITVIAACTTERPSAIVDVCVADQSSIYVLRRSCGKASPIVRLVVSRSGGAGSPSRSRSSSKSASTAGAVPTSASTTAVEPPSTSAFTSPVSGDLAPISASSSADAVAASSSADAVAAPHDDDFIETASSKLQHSVADFTDRFKNLVSKGLGGPTAAASTAEPEQPDERLAAVVRQDSEPAEGAVHATGSGEPAQGASSNVPSSSVSVAAAAAATPHVVPASHPQAQAGWMDKLRIRSAAPTAADQAESAKASSPAMPTPEARVFVRQWMTDQSPSMADEDDLVVSTPTQKKKKKKKKTSVKHDDSGVASAVPGAVTERGRSDSGLSADGDASGVFHLGDTTASASAMLQATQAALQHSFSQPGENPAPAEAEVTDGPAVPGSPDRASTPSTARAARAQSVGEVTEAVSTSEQRPTELLPDHALGSAAVSQPSSTVPVQDSPIKPRACSTPGSEEPRSPYATAFAAAAGRDRSASELSSADDLVSSWTADPNARASQEEVDEDGNVSDLVLQSYDASRPAHMATPEEDTDAGTSADMVAGALAATSPEHLAVPHRYNTMVGLDSASKLAPPSRRHIGCAAISRRHIWIADTGEYIYCWSADTLAWLHVKGAYAVALAASQSTDIVWALSRQGIVAARAGMCASSRLGRGWVKLEKLRMKCVAIDGDTAWLVTRDGQLMRRHNLVPANPLGEKWREESSSSLTKSVVQLAASNGVLWALSSHGSVLVRTGITEASPLGLGWEECSSTAGTCCIAIGPFGYAWCVNDAGAACFLPGVTADAPEIDGKQWWMVSLGQQLMKEASLLSTIKDASARVTSLWSSKHSDSERPVKLVVASCLGVCVVTTSSVLLYSTSDMLGMLFKPPSIASLADSTIWLLADASSAYKGKGLVWLLNPTGEVFSLPRGGRPNAVPVPEGRSIQRLSASNRGVFALTGDGTLYMRTGVTEYCLTGLSWDVVQLSSAMAAPVSVSCGNIVAWLVDAKGQAWIQGCDGEQFSNTWTCVGHPPHCKLVQIVVGPGDWHVWACDSSGAVHVRTGVGIDSPGGTDWETAPDVDVTDISVSTNSVWVRCTNGDIVRRANVSPRNPVGDYWRRIPGSFAAVSATPDDDELWLLDDNGRLFIRETHIYRAPRAFSEIKQASLESWEVL